MKKILSGGSVMLGIVLIVVAVLTFITANNYISYKKEDLGLQEKRLENELVDSCLARATVKTPEKEEPVLYVYDICIKDKGGKTVYTSK